MHPVDRGAVALSPLLNPPLE